MALFQPFSIRLVSRQGGVNLSQLLGVTAAA
jgi:hypothetical protein